MLILWNVCLCFIVIALFAHCISCLIVIFRSFWHPKTTLNNADQQAVTILRPVCGMENNLEQTLSSSFYLDHKQLEIIFCVAHADDPAIPLVKMLMAQHPSVSSSLIIGDNPISSNPKLNNLVKGWQAARYPWIVMADSNILLPSNYIAQLFSCWKKNTGLVSSPPIAIQAENFPAQIETAFLNSYQARWQLFSDMIGNGFAQGKTLFWRRDILDQAGGIQELAQEVAEDAAATKIIRRQSLKVHLTTMPFMTPLGSRRLKSVWDRQIRWAKLRRDSFPLFFYLEIFSGPLLPFLFLFIGFCFGQISVSIFIAYICLWYGVEIAATFIAGWPLSLSQLLAMLVRDLSLPILWCAAFGKKNYQWHGHNVNLYKNKR